MIVHADDEDREHDITDHAQESLSASSSTWVDADCMHCFICKLMQSLPVEEKDLSKCLNIICYSCLYI
jgi:hypothetical protein